MTDFEEAYASLKESVDVAIEVQREGRHGSNLGGFIDEVLRRVAAFSANGEYEKGAGEADNAFEQWQDEEAERQDSAKQQGSALLRAAANQYFLAGNAKEAAARFVKIVELETLDVSQRFESLRALQDEWYVRGRDRGLNLDLRISIEIALFVLDAASERQERGTALVDLATALSTLGQRESGTARLEEAVTAYRAALKEYDPRARAARLGRDAEQSRQCALRRSASARAARRGWRRR